MEKDKDSDKEYGEIPEEKEDKVYATHPDR